MLHHTKNKGDIATTQAIADLTLKGYLIFTPVICEHLPFDFYAVYLPEIDKVVYP